MNINFTETANFIWSIADLLRGDYTRSDYGRNFANTRNVLILKKF